MNHPTHRRAYLVAVSLLMLLRASGQELESPIYSFTGYYESIHGTLSYYPSTVHWSYLYQKDGKTIDGLRISMPHEQLSHDYDISELWGNDKGIIFICDDLTILVIKDGRTNSPTTPLITISKTSELQQPPAARSYFRYYSMAHSFESTAHSGVGIESEDR